MEVHFPYFFYPSESVILQAFLRKKNFFNIYPSNFELICSLLHRIHDVSEAYSNKPLTKSKVSLAINDVG